MYKPKWSSCIFSRSVAAISKPSFRAHLTPQSQLTPDSGPGPEFIWVSTCWLGFIFSAYNLTTELSESILHDESGDGDKKINNKLQQTTKNTFGPGTDFPDDQSIKI